MDKRTFERFMQRASTLTVQQVRELAEMLRKIDTRTEILSKIDARAAEIDHCPHCGSTRFGKWGSTRTGLMRLRCSDCLRTFSSATNTVVNRVRMTETFHEALSDMFSVYPLSCRRLAEQLGVHHMTIWRWRHRILDAVLGVGSSDMTGIVEADEKFFKESRKGSREWVNH